MFPPASCWASLWFLIIASWHHKHKVNHYKGGVPQRQAGRSSTLRESHLNSVLKFVCKLRPMPSRITWKLPQHKSKPALQGSDSAEVGALTRSAVLEASASSALTRRRSRHGPPDPEATMDSLAMSNGRLPAVSPSNIPPRIADLRMMLQLWKEVSHG